MLGDDSIVRKVNSGRVVNQIWRIQLEKPFRDFFEKFDIKIEVGGGSRSQQKIVRLALRTVCYTIFPGTKKFFDENHLVS